MNYQRIYDSLIERARHRDLRCYVESHHVIPKCMDGTDDGDNQVELTPEEHYVAHQLLVKIHPENDKLLFAAHMMCCGRTTNKLYGWLRRRHAEATGLMNAKHTGKNNSQFGTKWITDGKINQKIKKTDPIPAGWKLGRVLPHKCYISKCDVCGKKFSHPGLKKKHCCSDECLSKRRSEISRKNGQSNKGKLCITKIGNKNGHGNLGRKCSIEHRKKISQALIGKVVSDVTKEKLSRVNRGRMMSLESRAKISAYQQSKRARV